MYLFYFFCYVLLGVVALCYCNRPFPAQETAGMDFEDSLGAYGIVWERTKWAKGKPEVNSGFSITSLSTRGYHMLLMLTQTRTRRQSCLFYISKFELRGIIGNRQEFGQQKHTWYSCSIVHCVFEGIVEFKDKRFIKTWEKLRTRRECHEICHAYETIVSERIRTLSRVGDTRDGFQMD